MLTDHRTLVPNVAGVMVGIALFTSFLAVLQYVQTPPEVAGFGFGASVLSASVIYLVPGGVLGIAAAPFAGRVVVRRGALPTLLAGAVLGMAGFAMLAVLRGMPWAVVVGGALCQLAITVAFAALPALVVQAVERSETGVANAVNSIARSVGQALGSTVAVTLIAGSLDPATGFPRDAAYTQVALIGAAAFTAVLVVALLGIRADPHGGRPRRDPLADVEQATAGAGEWSPVSGIR